MEDSLKESTGDNLIDLKLNEDLNTNPAINDDMQGLLASDSVDQEGDPNKGKSKQKTQSSVLKKTVAKKVEPIKDSIIPHNTSEKGLLDNIGSQIHNDTEGTQPKLINKDLTEAARILNNQIGYVNDVNALDKQVAHNQSNWKQAGNAVARVGLKILPETMAQLGNALDFEDYFNSDDEVGNWLTNAMTKIEGNVDKALPIHRENPNKSLDITDPAYLFENAEKLITSIAGFAGAGFITAGAIDFSTLRGAKALSTLGKLAQGAETSGELGATAENIRHGVNTVAEAMMLNQAESVGIGLDTYNISYKRALEKLKADPTGLNKNNKQLDIEAKHIAAEDASSAIAFNRWNIALNLTSANLFFKKPTTTRFILNKEDWGHAGKEFLKEGSQEALEENLNDQAQNQALDKNYSFLDGLKYSFTAKGLESSIMGFAGGAGNTILTHVGKFIPMQDNNTYRETYVNEYAKATKEGLSEEEADVKAQQIALEKAGTNKTKVSAHSLHNQRYVQQQDSQIAYNERLANDNISDAILNLSNTADLTALHKELDLSIRQGNKVKANTLESILVGRMAQNAFDTGTTEGLTALFDGYTNLTHEQAEARNMYKKGDENTPEYYKTKAKETKKHIEKLENIYNTSKKYINNQEVYDLQERKLTLDNTIIKNNKAIADKFAEAEENYKDDKLKHPSFNKTYLDLESSTGFDINKVVPAFRSTQEYKDIKILDNATKDLYKLKSQYQEAINEVTTDKYQNDLKEAVLKNRERQAKEFKNEKKEKVQNTIKKENLSKVKGLINQLSDKVGISPIDIENLKTDNLPVVEDEEEIPQNNTKEKNIHDNSIKDKPRFVSFSKYDPVVDTVLEKLTNDLSSGERTVEENYNDVLDIYNKISGAKEGVASQFPLKANDYNKDVETLKNTLDELKVDLDTKQQNKNTLKQVQQQLIDSLLEQDNSPLTDNQSASPRTNVDFAKSKKESDLMFTMLNSMQELGIDINDFKSVLISFEENTSKDQVIQAFTKLKGLYIASTGNDVNGTYEDIMLSDGEKQQIITDFSNIKKFSIPQDIYISSLDPTTKEIINTHKELSKLSDLDRIDSAMGYEIYNDTASDLLGYLSKKYELKFVNKESNTGLPYTMISKEDIDNTLNPNLDKRILDPSFMKAGDKIKFIPLKSITLEDGSILDASTLSEDKKISNTPIGIEYNGELIKGIYLHNTDWINMTNTDLTANGVLQDQNKLNLVREIIINNGGIETTIMNKTPGVPIVNTDDSLHTVLEQTPNVEIGINKGGAIYTSSESKVDTIKGLEYTKEGQQVIIIPFGKEKLALPVSRGKLTTEYINSISTAVSLNLDGKQTNITKELKEQYRYDILTSKGLEAYLHNFINVANSLKAKTFEGFQDRINTVDDAASIISMVNGELMFGKGTGIRVNNISKSKYNDELGKPLSDKDTRIADDIQSLRKHLASTYVNINLDLLGKDIKIPIIKEDGKIEVEHDKYNDFAKSNMYSKYMSYKLDDDKEIYTIQGKITYDINSIIKNNGKQLVDSVDSKEEITNNIKKPQQKSSTITLPNGKQFNPDDVNTQDFSPITENKNFSNISEELENKIKSLPNNDEVKVFINNKILNNPLILSEDESIIRPYPNDNGAIHISKDAYNSLETRIFSQLAYWHKGNHIEQENTLLDILKEVFPKLSNENIYKASNYAWAYEEAKFDAMEDSYLEAESNNFRTEFTNWKDIATNYNLDKYLEKAPYKNIDYNKPNLLFSPEIEENHDYLLENSSFIKGLSIGTQTSIVKTIANDIYNEFLENKDKGSFTFDIKKQVDLAIQGFDLIKNNYINREDTRAQFVASQVDIIIENKDKILDAVRQILTPKIKRVSSINYNDELDDILGLEVTDTDEVRIFSDKSEYTIDPRTKLTEDVKQFLEGVIQRKVVDLGETKEYIPITNALGLNQFISTDIVFNDIMSISAKSNINSGFNSKENSIDESLGVNVTSYVKNFVYNLSKEVDSKPYLYGVIQNVLSAKPHLQNAIVSAFNKAHTHHIFLQSTYNSDLKKWSITRNVAASKSVTNLVLGKWLNNLTYSNIIENTDKGSIINKEAINNFKSDYNKLAKGEQTMTPQALNDLLNQIGINIPLNLFNVLNSGKFKQDDNKITLLQSFNQSNGIFKNIYNRVLEFDTTNSDALTLDTNNLYEDNAFRSLAKLISRYTDNLFNSNFKNGNGDTVYGFSNDRFMVSRTLDLKSDINLLNRLSSSVFTTGSEWLKGLLDTSGDVSSINKNSNMYKYFEYYTSDSLKVKNNALGKTIDQLSADELEKFNFGLYMNNGKITGKGNQIVPIITVLYPTMEEKSNIFALQVPGKHYELEEGQLKNEDVKSLVRQMFYPEISRIRAFNQNPTRVNVKEYTKGGHMFLMFPALNYLHDLYDGRELNNNGSIKEFGELKQIFSSAEEILLEKQIVNYFRNQATERITNWRKYGLVQTDSNGEYLTYIDDKYAKNFDVSKLKQLVYNYNINTTVANVNIQQLYLGDIAAYTKVKKGTNSNDYLKIAKDTSENQIKRLAVDNASANEILHESNETFNVLVANDVIKSSKVLPYLKELWEGHPDYKEIIDAYSNINSTDAQEITTLSEHVNMLFKEGKITEQQKKSVLDEYYKTGKISNQNKQLVLQPYKLRYGNNINRNGEDLRLHIKSSSFPLINQFTEGTSLHDLKNYMEDNKIDRLAFGSAVKVGQPLELVTLFDENDNFIKPTDRNLGLIENIPRKGHGNQQENPYDEDSNEVNDGTQQSKELFTNILDVKGFKHPITNEDITGRQSAELYHDTYNELFKNKYNDLVKQLDYNQEKNSIGNLIKLQKLLKEEGVNRNYNINDLDGLELNQDNTNFNVPLWLNASGIKIESLLSSVVDNRIRKRLFRGKSLIMTSNVGTQIKTLDNIDKSDVIKVGDWDGTLKSSYNKNGVITYAEVLAPFKFWNNNGKALKIEQFLNSNGTLDLNRLPQELLETFGYRIPTSGINLMTTIKIVGFLPNNSSIAYGDILIAPDDFITQMGLDFDIDKLYTHMYNTYYNPLTKSLEKINKSLIDKRNKLKELIIKGKESLKELTGQDKKDRSADLDYLNNNDLLKSKDLDINNAYLENLLLDIHKSILNNPTKEVQQARTKPLSFGDLPNLVEKFDVKPISKYFTPISNMYQQDKYLSARAGKAAVGVFSLDMVFNSVVQHIEEPMEFYEIIGKDINFFSINLFGQRNESINNIKTIKKDKYKSDVIEAFMASALDNGNEQILGKLNVNNHTFDFIRGAVSSGYDENTIISMTMQPIILDYVEKKQLNKSTNANLETNVSLEYVKLKDIQDIITDPNADKSIDTDLQKAIMLAFIRVSDIGSQLKRVQSAINSDSSGVGKNIFYSIEKAKQITELPNSTNLTNVEKLIGKYRYMDETSFEDLDRLKEEGYILYNGTLIKPNSLGGFAGVYATLLNAELWNKYFPYNNEKFKLLTNYSFKGKTDLKDTLTDKAKQQQQIAENYKSLLASNTYRIFENYNSIYDVRQELLYDTKDNKSLGTILDEVKKEGYNNLLLDRLVVNRGRKTINDGKLPTTIDYYNSGNIEMDEQQVINSFVEMIVDNKSLGNYNGKNLTTRDLANKLIQQQIINGGIQRSTQFIKFIPFKYLQKFGYYNNLESTNDLFDNITSNDIAIRLRTQTIQHYPEQYYNKDIEDLIKPFIKDNKIVGLDNENLKNSDIIVTKSIGDRYNIWKYNSETDDYNKIDNLGYNGLLEYDINKEIGKSNIYINQIEDNNIENKNEYIPSISDSVNFLRLDRDTTQDNSPLIYNTEAKDIVKSFSLDDNSLSIEDKYRVILNEVKDTTSNSILRYFSEKLQDVIPYLSETPLKIDTNIKAKGITETSPVLGEPMNIKINPNNIRNNQEMGEVLIEEMTHAILKSSLNNPSNGFSRNIDNIREEVKKDLIKRFGQEKFDTMLDKLSKNLPLENNIEASLLYPLINNDEFIAAAIKNREFQKLLNSTEATHVVKTLWERFIESIKTLLIKLGVKEDSNLEAVLHETINLFDDINKYLHNELNIPKFIRTIEYLNNKFNLTDESSSLLTKGNSEQIVEFINKTIVNVNAISDNGKVKLNYKNNDLSLSPEVDEFKQFGNSGELVNYIQSLDLRINKLKENIRKAKENNNLHKAELLQLDLDKEQLKRTEVTDVTSAINLANKAEQDLQVVETILKRPMGSEDIVYVKHIVNFWQDAKQFIFTPDMYESNVLSGIYGNIESKAEILGHKLFLLEKNYLEEFVKKYIGSNIDLNQMFEDYKDINGLQSNFRDISVYDNKLLTSMWSALKEADIKAKDESNKLLEKHDESLKKVIPILKFMGNKEIFEPFMQKTERGKRTHQLVTPYNTKYYSEKDKLIKVINREENSENMNKYVRWLGNNSINTDLSEIFPLDNRITNEVENARIELKSKIGEGKYNYWFQGQERKIKQYNASREASIQHIIDDFDLKNENDINNNQKALARYESWIRRNSPYHLEDLVHKEKQFTNTNYNFNSQNYYEVLSIDEKYLDKNFSIIENNKILLDYYYEVKEVFDELRKYIPNYQIQDLMYGGIPTIEKSIIEMYSEKGMELGFKPLREALAKSVQSSFGDNSSIVYDPVTKDKVKQMRIPLIKNNYKEINNYIEQKKAEYLLQNKEEASKEKIKEFKEDIIDEISKRNSFDLGKITKVFATLVLSHKHKAKIEDDVKIINSVLNSYQETRLRPDGTPEINSVKGTIERKDKSQSFLNTKKSFNNYIGNIFYNEIKDEEGKGKILLTPNEKEKSGELNSLLKELEIQHNNELIDDGLYENTKEELEQQINNLGKTKIASKYGDNVLKYIQLKLMGWNFLGGIANMTFGWVSNQIEGAGGQIYSTKDLRKAYTMVSNSMLKNITFNQVETETAKKIRNIMDGFDILKDASKELYSDSIKSDLNEKIKWLAPYNMNQRGEYINQAVLMIALFKNTKVTTTKGDTNLYDVLDNNGEWNTAEHGEKQEQLVIKIRIKLDQLVKRLHGNYDNMSPLAIKKTITGRAVSQFRTFLFENIADRFQDEREDDILGVTVKGRYRSVATVWNSTNLTTFSAEVLKGILKNYSLGLYKGGTFEGIQNKDGSSIRDIDAVNMRKVAMEATLAMNLYLALALLKAVIGGNDDDENNLYNLLFNQGVRLRTDLIMYVNPIEARNLAKDIVPAFSTIEEITKWMGAIEQGIEGKDEIKSGINVGDSRIRRTTNKLIPFVSKIQSTIDSANQMFDNNR